MALGRTPAESDLFGSAKEVCDKELSETSIYKLLHREGHRLFPDEAFADLFTEIGRSSVPPQIVATVMVLQRVEGLSDREAVERFRFDMRWKYAAGGLSLDYPGFVHTVLVDFRARLRASKQPNRIFDVTVEMTKAAGLVGRKRVLDSTALYDAVATQDTVTMIRSSIRALLKVADKDLAKAIGAVLKRDDDYVHAGKPICDWDDEGAREELLDALARDAYAVIALLDGCELVAPVKQAADLVATVVGQDLEQRDDGVFRIVRGVAPARTISVVDPEARHGHKTSARGFDGYKGHIALDPESEIIVATTVTAANVGDADAANELLAEALGSTDSTDTPIEVYGDASYGSAELIEHVEKAGAVPQMKVQLPTAREGMFSQEQFLIDSERGEVTCPAGQIVLLRKGKDGFQQARFAQQCDTCPLRAQCTASKGGRTIQVHPKHTLLHRERQRQKQPAFKRIYKATRPKIERKFGHLMRRKHGGRRARMRGRLRIAQDFATLAAGVNLCRLAVLRSHAKAPAKA